jgi:hypothetical protein
MVERLFFSKLVTKDLSAVESNRRLFEGVLTVEMKDRQGEITIRDELLKVLPIWLARGGPITDTHSNRVVGQGINFGSTVVTDDSGNSYPAITIQGEIFNDYELDNEIWEAIKSGKYKGLSFGGATKSNRTPIMQKDGSLAYSLKDLEQYEVAVCEEPAVPLALITQHNEIAKAIAGDVKERGDGTMCIRCDKFKCYIEKDSLIKIEDDEDDDTQVTVLDEWKNETHPDKNGKTEGIRTTKNDPCWEGYEQFGMKEQGGRQVPNCVKKADEKKPLNKPFRTPGGPKKFAVYVRDPKTGNVVTVRFGDPNMEIKRDSDERRSSFRARHRCDEQKDITSAAYWSCKMWEKRSSVTDNTNKGDNSFSDTRGPNTPNKDEDAEALENNRGEPQENGATYHGTSKGRTHTCDSDVAEINNVEVGDRPSGQNMVKDDGKAMDVDDDEMLEEADLEEVEKLLPAAGAAANVVSQVADSLLGNEDDLEKADDGIGRKYGEGGKDQFGNPMPKVMRKKPSEVDTAQDQPGSRYSTRQTPMGEKKPSTSQMSQEQLERRRSGDWNKPKQEGPKVGGKKIKPRATVTHDRDTGQTTIDSSKLRRGSMGTTTMPTERYISGIGKSLDILNLLFKIRTGQKLITAREGGKQGVKDSIVGNKKLGRLTESETPGNVNPRKESMEHGSVGDASTSNYQATHLDPDVAEKLKYNKEYNTCEVVREYNDSKKKLENKATGEAPYTEPGRGGFAGREEGETCDKNESTSIHNVNQPKHVNEPYDDEEAEGVKKDHLERKIGMEVELEFTDDEQKAKETVEEHLQKDPKHYSRLKNIFDKLKNDRAMAANNSEDGVNGKMRLDNDPPAEALNEDPEVEKKVQTGDYGNCSVEVEGKNVDAEMNPGASLRKDTAIMDPGSGSGGIRSGASYDNAQQDTGQKDNPRKVKEEEYSGEEDRGSLNPKYSGEEDTVTGATRGNYNKATLILNDLLLKLKLKQ